MSPAALHDAAARLVDRIPQHGRVPNSQHELDCLQAAQLLREAADEIERQTGVISRTNARCDHLGMRLGEVIRERDAERERCADLCDRAADAAWIAWDAAADPIDQGRALEAEELAMEIRGTRPGGARPARNAPMS